MRAKQGPAHDSRGMEARTAHLRLEVDLDTEPITGYVAAPDTRPHEFTGYAGLIAALQSIRAGEPAPLRAKPTEHRADR